MKRLKKIPLFLLLVGLPLVVAVSGCVFPGQQNQQTVEAPEDVMVFSDITVIPTPPVTASDVFTTYFTIENKAELEDAGNVTISLYDSGMCISLTKNCSNIMYFGDISPGDVQTIECQFKAPSSTAIGGMQASCPIRYKLSYRFYSLTQADITVISDEKFREMQRAGQTPSVVPAQTKTRGPLKINFDVAVTQPVRTSTTANTVSIPVFITIEDKGTGMMDYLKDVVLLKEGETIKEVEKNTSILSLSIPKDLAPDKNCDNLKLRCGDTMEYKGEFLGMCVFANIKKIEFVKGKSQPIQCVLQSPSDVTDMKTYYIKGITSYTYEIYKDVKVAIKPPPSSG